MCSWAEYHQEEGRRASTSCSDPSLARPKPSQARPLWDRLTLTLFLRARPLSAPALTLRPTEVSEAKDQHAGQGWNVSLLWLAGDCGPPGSGSTKECMGITTLT